MLALLRQRSFAVLWSGGLISVAGDWVLYAALPFFVFERTGSTVATSGMVAAELVPSVIVGPFAGVHVDRLDRRRLLIVANLLQALAVLALLDVARGGGLWIVYAAAAVQATIASFAVPAEGALLPALVRAEELVTANALGTLGNRLARLTGVPLGGILLGRLGLQPVIVVDAVSFIAAAALISLVRPPASVPVQIRTGFLREWLDGLRLVREDRTVAALFAVLGLMTFGGTMLDPLYVAWVRDVLHRGASVYGLLLTTSAIAGIAGSLLVGRFASFLTPRTLMGWSSVTAGIALAVKWDVPVAAVAFALSAVSGVTSVASAVGVETWVQRSVRDTFRGRVLAALGASGAFFSLAGALTGGIAAQFAGVTPMLNVSAGLIVAAGLVVLRLQWPGQ